MRYLRALTRFFLSQSRATRDLVVLGLFGVPGSFFLADADVFHFMMNGWAFMGVWELDEFFGFVTGIGTCVTLYGYRRINDLRGEVEARIAAQDCAMQLALNDPLTGLANRRHFETHLRDLIAHEPNGPLRALYMIDLDGFKPVNDVYGHQMGDMLLVEFGALLTDVFGVEAFIARLGGDEFAIISGPLKEPGDAVRLGENLLARMQTPIMIEEVSLNVTASVGSTLLGQVVTSADEALRRADDALYRVKESGKNQCAFADDELDETRRKKARIEAKLRQALAAGRIDPFFQPIVDLRTKNVKGFEALARWRDEEDGYIPPGVFIPIAESSGLIVDITEQLLRKACLVAIEWPASFSLSFNMSAVQLRDRQLPLKIAKIVAETGLSPTRLEIEVTESAFIADMDTAREVLTAIRALGVRIALDDFGTGYSSLYHLRELNFDKVKIDRSFITNLKHDHNSRVIVAAILGITKALGVVSTAEGIEDPYQEGHLLEEGCSEGQGYLFGKPVSSEETMALILDAVGARKIAKSA